ncbi:hypothetical protein F0Q53_01010 [Anaplasma marginale]|uniref:Uncharacterized protein n=1 Tax=Anaplasma marginale TaxID=770 RepID=A0A643CM73_ANAMA|nr:hypothetical protein [Anaplasma marginale]KAA8474981.1 hypothetical protein F0Q53_01010 [Anaplasma marginale]KAB0452563.1 hypothetical protein FY207_01265 [Anaplasma marginale]
MTLSLSIPRKMLKIEKLNYIRQCCSIFTLLITTTMFILLALSQAGLLSGMGASAANFWTAMEFLTGLTASLGVICGLILVFKIEKDKRKIQQRIELESRRMGLQSKISLERVDRKPLDKASDFMEAHANKVDLAASVLFTTIHLVGLGVLLYSGLSLSGHVKVGGMGVTQITDMVVNALFFASALMFAVSFWIIHRNKPTCSKNVAHQARLTVLYLCGNFLLFGGKVVLVMESVGKVTSAPLSSGGTFPIGWALRVVGILLVLTSVVMMLTANHEKCTQLKRMVESGEGTERLAMLSTHEIRSCFGYQECRLSR